MGAEIAIGVIIGVLFELFSNTEGTPRERRNHSNSGTLENRFRTIRIANAPGVAK